jgi:histidinol-phosphate/aromatic aminotransferase/cobyric acid decarboxylase-like protein
LIDESFISCIGPDWMEYSSLTLIEEFSDGVIICCSWTKVLACPFVRIGTLFASENILKKVQKFQIHWSVKEIAQEFFISAIHQSNYFKEMWELTPQWKIKCMSC